VRNAVRKGYIRRVSDGCFDPHGGKASRPAQYAVHWLTDTTSSTSSSKTEPDADQFRNRTGRDPKTEPDNQFKNRTNGKTRTKDTLKQHQFAGDDPMDSRNNTEPFPQATQLVHEYHRLRFGVGECQPQPHELKHAAGLLETGNLEDLVVLLPEVIRLVQQHYRGDDLYFGAAVPYFTVAQRKRGQAHQAHRKTEQDNDQHRSLVRADAMQRQRRQKRRSVLLARWADLSTSQRQRFRRAAIDRAPSETVRRRLNQHRNLDQPATEVLEAMAVELKVPIGD
jgi:hypothetical protein